MTTQPPLATSAEPAPAPPRDGVLRFGVFEFDLARDELRKAGAAVRLQPQPLKLLRLLAGHPRKLFTREEIQRELWGNGTHVDFEQGINFCVSRVRAALGDQADSPRFVETLPRRGYRWIGPVEWVPRERDVRVARLPGPAGLSVVAQAAPPLPGDPAPRPARRGRRALLALGLVLTGSAMAWAWRERAQAPPTPETPAWTRVTLRAGSLVNARFGPGDELVYAAAWDGEPTALYAGHAGQPDARALAVKGVQVAGVSGRREMAFFVPRARGTLAQTALDGDVAKAVASGVAAADWDGVDYAVARPTASGNVNLEYPLGHVITSLMGVTDLRISPDRTRVAVLEQVLRDDDRGRLIVVDRDGARLELGPTWSSAPALAWSPRGDEVWLSAARTGSDLGLWAVRLDGRLRLLLPPSGRVLLHDLDARGRALIERRVERIELPTSVGGGPERNLSPLGNSLPVAFSRDGRHLLLVETGEGAGPEYASFLRPTDGGQPVRVGHGRATDLSPDGSMVAAIPISQPDHIDLLPVGPGAPTSVRHTGIVKYAYALFHPDGEHLLFRASEAGGALALWLGSRSGGAPRRVAHDRFVVSLAASGITPDGARFVARGTDRLLYLVPFDGTAPRAISGVENEIFGGLDGNDAVFVGRPSNFPLQIERLDLRTGRRQPWRRVGPADAVGVAAMTYVRVAPEGRAVTYAIRRRLSELFVVDGLR
jgi:DNA-binding winged helix-turn-helix (wHTH) protein